jgi:threonine dehydrogenase-like Zn-dependent dehydrogenase
MRAVLVERLPHRFIVARAASALGGSTSGVRLGPTRLADVDPPALPGPSWHRIRPRLAGICGSDLHTVDGESSRYFEDIVSFPFVLGHEIVADVLDGPLQGRRVVVEPVLGCLARAIEPPCEACAKGRKGACERLHLGRLAPGLQTGFCKDTGGGWSDELVAHESQLHEVPGELSDEAAVLVEPTACAVHAAFAAGASAEETVVVLGAGTLGLATTAALRHFRPPARLLVIAKHDHQRRLANELGADMVAEPAQARRAVRRLTGALGIGRHGDSPARLAGGADVVLDCVGSASSLEESLSLVRSGGRVILVGMPGKVHVDLAPLWQREIRLVGAYAYGVEDTKPTARSTFDLAFELVAAADLGRLVSARYALERYDEALRHAASAGRRGAVKVVFDLRRPEEPWRGARRSSVAEASPAAVFETKEERP